MPIYPSAEKLYRQSSTDKALLPIYSSADLPQCRKALPTKLYRQSSTDKALPTKLYCRSTPVPICPSAEKLYQQSSTDKAPLLIYSSAEKLY